jgi:hypothetical protein
MRVTRLQTSYIEVTLKRNLRALCLQGLREGYISYVTLGQNKNIIHNTLIYTIYNKYIYLLIFNVTNVTSLLTPLFTGVSRLRYNVTLM